MLFPTIEFAIFFALVFPLTWLLNDHNTAKKWFLVAVSYCFYAFWRADFTLILLTSSVVNFCLAVVLWLGVLFNLGVLGAFKYYNFFAASAMNLTASLGWNIDLPFFEVGLPI